MEVVAGTRPDVVSAAVVTLGMFDGVHRGHQVLLQTCKREAAIRGLPAVALTYEPHPSFLLHPEHPVPLLTPLKEKLLHLARCGMDYTVIPHFTREFSLLSPQDFLCDVLVASLHPVLVVAGYRTTFGHGRAGNAGVLREFAKRHAIAVEIVEPIEVAGCPVSSSRIRQCLAEGNVELASSLLGYHYEVTGVVTPGDQRGRQLGIPTANLQPPSEKLIPADGVYIVDVPREDGLRRAVMSIGNRPTFDRPRTLEVHILDYADDLYGQELTVIFRQRLREVQSFSSQTALLAQIRDDIAAARTLASNNHPE